MTRIATAFSTAQAAVVAIVIIGCSTAAVVTGHISGADFLAVVGGVGIVGGGVTTAHVVGTQVNTAQAAAQAPQGPAPTIGGVTASTPAVPGPGANVGPSAAMPGAAG